MVSANINRHKIMDVLPPDHQIGVGRFGFHRLIKERPDFFQLVPGQTILDIGCGNAEARFYFPDAQYVGIDVYLPNMEPAIHESVTLLLGSAETLPFEDNAFDFIFCNWVLEYVPDFRACISEISRVLKPEGRAYFCVPTPLAKIYNEYPLRPFNLLGYERRNIMTQAGNEHYFDTMLLAREFAEKGLRTEFQVNTVGSLMSVLKLCLILFALLRKALLLPLTWLPFPKVNQYIKSISGTVVPVPPTTKSTSIEETIHMVKIGNQQWRRFFSIRAALMRACFYIDRVVNWPPAEVAIGLSKPGVKRR